MAKRKLTKHAALTRSINYLGHAIGSLDNYSALSDEENRSRKADVIIDRMVKIYYAIRKLK